MSLRKFFLSLITRVVIWIIRCGPVPHHLAIIMDGNRRFAKKVGVDKDSGHRMGYKALVDKVQILHSLGIKVLSLYAFSVDNFKRSASEVDALMQLLAEILGSQINEEDSVIKQYKMRVIFMGQLYLLPSSARESAERIMEMTRLNEGPVVNVCVPYTSREEIAHAFHEIVAIESVDQCVDEDNISSHFYSPSCPPVDLLIRTSGETRLSNFLLWQCSHAYLNFLPVLWPEFSALHLVYSFFMYQLNYSSLCKLRVSNGTSAMP